MSLTKRTLTLALSETLNFAVQFLSPIFLTRILDIKAYGQYREFIVYSSLALTFTSFSIKSNLLYFISKDPDNEKKYIGNTVILLFILSSIGAIVLFILKGYFRSITSYDFVPYLIIYIMVYQNIDLLDNLWLAKKRSDYVLYWSSTNAIVRTGLLLAVAYFTRDIFSIIYLLIILELLKTSVTVTYLVKAKLFSINLNFSFLREQLKFIVPSGIAVMILKFNTDISKVIISSNLGPAALAIYAVGSQNIPLLNIIRNSVSNVIFPEMANKISRNPLTALNLWNKSNVLYLFLMAPLFIILFFYSHLIIETLFTAKYLAAVPLFQIYLLLMIRKCFEMGTPIRALNKNKYFVIGNILSFIVNIILLFTLFKLIGFLGPAIAAVATEFTLAIFLASKILDLYKIKIKDLLSWNKLLKIVLTSILTMPILFIDHYIHFMPKITAIILSGIYFAIYLLIIRRIGIEEVDLFMNKMLKFVKIKWKTT